MEYKEEAKIRKCYIPTYLGVGCLGENYNNKTDFKIKDRWENILDRCYNPNNSSYSYYGANGVTVCDEWLNFSNFKIWFLENYWECENERIVIDKDILVPNNKTYAPDKCICMPLTFNVMFARANKENKTKENIFGASGIECNSNGKYTVDILGKSISNFISVENARETKINVYKALIEGMVNNYPTMPDKVKNAILNYDFHSVT